MTDQSGNILENPNNPEDQDWLTGMFNSVQRSWNNGYSWLSTQFHTAGETVNELADDAGNYLDQKVNPVRWFEEAVENTLGEAFISAALGVVIDWLDSDKTTTADDGYILGGLKGWAARVERELAERRETAGDTDLTGTMAAPASAPGP